jgi:hypothetical protein
MGKYTSYTRTSVFLNLKKDLVKEKELKLQLKNIDAKAQQMLLWSTLSSVWSYLILIVTICRIYAGFKGAHALLLIICMVVTYLLLGVLIYRIWKGMDYKRSYFYYASKTYLNYQIIKLSGQRKLILLYLLTYGSLLVVAGIFFFYDVENGLIYLLKVTAPVSIITSVFGIYFVSNFTKQIRNLELVHNKINQHITANLNLN